MLIVNVIKQNESNTLFDHHFQVIYHSHSEK